MIDFTQGQSEVLSEVLEKDLLVLREANIMDYSLLLIILHYPKKTDPDYDTILDLFGNPILHHRIFKSKNMKYIYILGIIDYLQKFKFAKSFERTYKTYILLNNQKYLSAVHPVDYSNRMLKFIRDYVFIGKNEEN